MGPTFRGENQILFQVIIYRVHVLYGCTTDLHRTAPVYPSVGPASSDIHRLHIQPTANWHRHVTSSFYTIQLYNEKSAQRDANTARWL